MISITSPSITGTDCTREATAAAIPLPPRKKQKRAKKIHKTNSEFVQQIEVTNKATVFHAFI